MKTIKAVEMVSPDWVSSPNEDGPSSTILKHKPNLAKLALEFFRYTIVGGAAFVVDYLVLNLALSAGSHYMVATLLGFMFGLLTNYTLCVLWVWRGTTARTMKDFLMFSAIGVGGLLLTAVLMWVSVELLHMDARFAKIYIAALVLIWNFALRRVLVFFR